MSSFLYTLLVGIPICLACFGIGVFLCCTIVGIPAGLAMFAIGNRALTLNRRPVVHVS